MNPWITDPCEKIQYQSNSCFNFVKINDSVKINDINQDLINNFKNDLIWKNEET